MCALSGSEAELALRVNQWDLKLFEEGKQLEALDQTFFERPEVLAVLAPHLTPDMPSHLAGNAAVGSVAGCGLLSEGVSVSSHASNSAQPDRTPSLGAAPICIHKRFRNGCCWGVGGAAPPVPMPQLPWPTACVLPPAGRLSSQSSVRLPAVPFKQ